jgi:hypothetical protein
MSARIDRREMLKLVGAGVGGAALATVCRDLGLPAAWGGGAQPSATVDVGGLTPSRKAIGRWIYLTPQKLGGGTHAVDMASSKTLAWIAYWNYGDTCPISHHLAAYPSEDPYKGFEYVNSTQGGENVLIYGIPTHIKQMGLLERTGLYLDLTGLGCYYRKADVPAWHGPRTEAWPGRRGTDAPFPVDLPLGSVA